MDKSYKDKMQQAWEKVMGTKAPEEFDDIFIEQAGRVFADIWTRPELGQRERRITTLTCIALGGAASSGVLEFHLKAAVTQKDLTIDELVEWAGHLAHYGGLPHAANAYTAIQKVKADLDKG